MSAPVCDLCGAPGTPSLTGTVYCGEHPPGAILVPGDWDALCPEQRQRRSAANAAQYRTAGREEGALPAAPAPAAAAADGPLRAGFATPLLGLTDLAHCGAVVVHDIGCDADPCTCGHPIRVARGETLPGEPA